MVLLGVSLCACGADASNHASTQDLAGAEKCTSLAPNRDSDPKGRCLASAEEIYVCGPSVSSRLVSWEELAPGQGLGGKILDGDYRLVGLAQAERYESEPSPYETLHVHGSRLERVAASPSRFVSSKGGVSGLEPYETVSHFDVQGTVLREHQTCPFEIDNKADFTVQGNRLTLSWVYSRWPIRREYERVAP